MLDKDQVINQLEGRTFLPEDTRTYNFTVFKSEDDEFKLLFEDPETGDLLLGDTIDYSVEEISDTDDRLIDSTDDGDIDEINGYTRLEQPEVIQNLGRLEALRIDYRDNELRMKDLNSFALYRQRYEYISEEDKIIDLRDGYEFTPVRGHFL